MRADVNANKAIKFYLGDEGRSFDRFQRAESIPSKRESISEDDEEKQVRAESWHTFQTP